MFLRQANLVILRVNMRGYYFLEVLVTVRYPGCADRLYLQRFDGYEIVIGAEFCEVKKLG